MKIWLKRILKFGVSLLILGVVLYQITMWHQEKIVKEYSRCFNPQRKEIGLMEISSIWEKNRINWNYWNRLNGFNFQENTYSKFKTIWSLENIETMVIYEPETTDIPSTFKWKVINFNSNVLFWKNGIESEIDFYERNIDSVTIENVTIRYYFKDDNGNKNYFEADHNIYKTNEFSCGTPSITEREEQRLSGKPYFGNINKQKADLILKSWHSKD